MREGWHEAIEEMIRLEVNEAVESWRQDAYLHLTDFDEGAPLMVEMRIPEYDDGFPADVVRPRLSLADLFRDYIHGATFIASGNIEVSDEALLAATEPNYHADEQRKLKFGQDVLRLVLAYEAERRAAEAEDAA